jgi:exodeoxyribonuclease VII small subunit
MSVSTHQQNFEESLKELEKIVTELEKGELPLEGQLKAFERGVALSRDCIKQLEDVEQKVETLIENSNGSLSTRPFEPAAQ